MRTNPASTIGEIGAGAGLAATASASGDNDEILRKVRDTAPGRPTTAVALDALSGGRTSVLFMGDAITHARGAQANAPTGFPLMPGNF
jgi:hypothetical protein